MSTGTEGGDILYRIGMFSKLGRVTIKTLHHYDAMGLLMPGHVDGETGYRYYTTDQLFRLNEIIALRQMGFSIPEISEMIDGHNITETLARRKAELDAEARAVAERRFRLEQYIKERKEGSQMQYQAVVKEIPAYTVYSAAYTLPTYAALNDIMPALNDIMPALGEKVRKANPGLRCAEPDYCFNVYLDGEYRETDIRVEICQAVTSRGRDAEGITFKELPAITAVSVLHRGAYETLGEAYAYALQWVERNGYRMDGDIRESFIDGVWNKAQPEDWLTEIQVPIQRK